MKSKLFITGLLITVAMGATPSFADHKYSGPISPSTHSTLTREAVIAEYMAAKKNGTLPPLGDRGHSFAIPNTPSTLTREAVIEEYLAAKNSGALQVIRR